MTVEVSIIAPCYNEAGNIPELVARLNRTFEKKDFTGEIILVDDGSTDNTSSVISGIMEKTGNVKTVQHNRNQGIEAAWRSGLELAAGRYVCLIDSDLQNLPEDVWRLYREIDYSKADVVQGYRSSIGRLRDSRYFLSKALNFILNILFRMRAKDNKSGFIIAPKNVLEDVLRTRYRYNYFQSFIAVSANAKGYTIREIETLFQDRIQGRSFMSRVPIKVIMGCLLDLFWGFLEFRLFPKRENILGDYLRTQDIELQSTRLPGIRRIGFELYFALMPLHKWMITRRAKTYYKELAQSQWLSPDKIRELQLIKLKKLLHHSYNHVAYYRQLFDQLDIKPGDIRSLEDLNRIPLLTKDIIRSNLYFDLFSDNHNKRQILRITTSGSTGEPFVFFVDRHQLEIRWAATLRSMEWTGYRFFDRQIRLWHQTLGMSKIQAFRERLDAVLSRRYFIPAFAMSIETIARYIDEIKKYNPVLLDGYAESFSLLSQYIRAYGLEGIQPKGIISSAQVLPDNVRQIIEKAFHCPVFDKYGSREFSGIAYECEEHNGYHTVAESYIVEILKDGKPAKAGELGEVVITDLNNYCVPFIRYRIGDLATAPETGEPCRCGRGLPKIGKIEGRVQSIIVGSNGRYIPGTFFSHLFKDYDYLMRKYQIIQEARDKITLKFIKGPLFTDESFNIVLKEITKYLGEQIDIQTVAVEEIPTGRTGKHQSVISNVPIDFQAIPAEAIVNG